MKVGSFGSNLYRRLTEVYTMIEPVVTEFAIASIMMPRRPALGQGAYSQQTFRNQINPEH